MENLGKKEFEFLFNNLRVNYFFTFGDIFYFKKYDFQILLLDHYDEYTAEIILTPVSEFYQTDPMPPRNDF